MPRFFNLFWRKSWTNLKGTYFAILPIFKLYFKPFSYSSNFDAISTVNIEFRKYLLILPKNFNSYFKKILKGCITTWMGLRKRTQSSICQTCFLAEFSQFSRRLQEFFSKITTFTKLSEKHFQKMTGIRIGLEVKSKVSKRIFPLEIHDFSITFFTFSLNAETHLFFPIFSFRVASSLHGV